ncbi:MAG: N-acetylmuramoyl-L-alanine amidase [Elainellaceae cyanobacterium]
MLISSGLGVVGALLLSSPVLAAQLEFWRFDTAENQLVFTTDEVVRPRAQLLQNPTRILIDLPGTTLVDTERLSQSVGGAVARIRVEQLDPQVTRLIVEYNSGYRIDPQAIRVQGVTPTQWRVQLPEAQLVSGAAQPPVSQPPSPPSTIQQPSPPPVAPSPVAQTPVTQTPDPSPASAATQITGIVVTPDGFFLRTTGVAPEITAQRRRRRRDRRRLVFDIENAALAPGLVGEQTLNRYGVETIEFEQDDETPSNVRMTLNFTEEDQQWQASASNLGGIVLIPTRGVDGPPAEPVAPPIAESSAPTAVTGLRLDSSGLTILANQPLTEAIAGWDRSSVDYRIVIPDARLDPNAVTQLQPNPLFARAQLQQDGDQVVVSLLPALGTQLGDIQPGDQGLVLAFESSRAVLPPTAGTPPSSNPLPPISQPLPPASLPRVPDGRILVVIDPGHGGFDPGAVGRGGLQEKNIVLPVSLQVAQILEQQGVSALLTRRVDREIDLEPRVQIAERANATLFVSIHANAISLNRPDVNGIETYYTSGQGQRFAQIVHSSLLQATGGPDRGVRQARFYVLRNTSMPAILVETGFVTGAQDAPRLADPAYQTRLAQGIARGILQYIQQTFR